MYALAIGGEVVLLLALLGHPDIGNDGVIFAGGEAQRPVDPGNRYDFDRQAQNFAHQPAQIRVEADYGGAIGGIGGDRRRTGGDGDAEHAVLGIFEIRRQLRGDRIDLFGVQAVGRIRAEVEGLGEDRDRGGGEQQGGAGERKEGSSGKHFLYL